VEPVGPAEVTRFCKKGNGGKEDRRNQDKAKLSSRELRWAVLCGRWAWSGRRPFQPHGRAGNEKTSH
jgi:hypothetical protein